RLKHNKVPRGGRRSCPELVPARVSKLPGGRIPCLPDVIEATAACRPRHGGLHIELGNEPVRFILPVGGRTRGEIPQLHISRSRSPRIRRRVQYEHHLVSL